MYMTIRCLFFFLIVRAFVEGVFEPHPLNKSEGREADVSLCCVFQNEADWLREWIEYHKLVGISHFYLYNNDSKDKYLEVLTPYLLTGEVELFEYSKTPFQVCDQPLIYNHALSLACGHSQWLAAFDTDEFLVPVQTKNLMSYLNTFPKDVGCIEINWLTFGTSRVKRLLPGELLIEKLILRAPIHADVNHWVKSIARTDATNEWIDAHFCSLKKGYLTLRPTAPTSGGAPMTDADVSQIRLHHYMVRTEDFFYQVKLPRIAKWDMNLLQGKAPSSYLQTMNSVLDFTMLEFVPVLKTNLAASLSKHAQ